MTIIRSSGNNTYKSKIITNGIIPDQYNTTSTIEVWGIEKAGNNSVTTISDVEKVDKEQTTKVVFS
jgi:hypothetical protein